MESTTVTLDTDTVMDLRAIKVEMSRSAGRSVPLRLVVRELIACWRKHNAAGAAANRNREETPE